MSEVVNKEIDAVNEDLNSKIEELANKKAAEMFAAKQKEADIETKANELAKNRLTEMLAAGSAPAIKKDMGHHIKSAVSQLRCKSLSDVFGSEQNDMADGKVWGVNFSKEATHIDPELRKALVELKRDIIGAKLQHQYRAAKYGTYESIENTQYFKEFVAPKLKAYDAATFAAQIPTIMPRMYFEDLEFVPMLRRYFPVRTMLSQIEQINGYTQKLVAQLQIDSSSFTSQNRSESHFTLTAKDFVEYSVVTQDLIDDAIPSTIDAIIRDAAQAQERAIERAIIDGDTSGTHQDSDVTASTDARKAWAGLRKLGLANAANGGSVSAGNAYTKAAVYDAAFLKLTPEAAVNPEKLLYIVGGANGNMLRVGRIPDVIPVNAVNLAGSPAFSLSQAGEIPVKINGVGVYQSSWIRQDLNASGVYDGTTTTQSTAIIVKTDRFLLGERMPIKMWMERLQGTDTMFVCSKTRYAFGGVTQSATERSVVDIYNIPKT